MNVIRKCINGLLYQTANLYIFVGKIDKAIELFAKLKERDPTDNSIRHALSICYSIKNNEEEAKKELEEALAFEPDDWLLNQLFVSSLYQAGEPIEKLVPYIKKYFKNRPAEKSKFPVVMKLFAKVFRPKVDWDANEKQLDTYVSEWDAWAESILRKYESSNEE